MNKQEYKEKYENYKATVPHDEFMKVGIISSIAFILAYLIPLLFSIIMVDGILQIISVYILTVFIIGGVGTVAKDRCENVFTADLILSLMFLSLIGIALVKSDMQMTDMNCIMIILFIVKLTIENIVKKRIFYR